jgi:hypothetical protein
MDNIILKILKSVNRKFKKERRNTQTQVKKSKKKYNRKKNKKIIEKELRNEY